MPLRVIAYIDAFNLYFGLRDSGLERYLWLDIRALAGTMLRPNQQLAAVKYFTARISGSQPGQPQTTARDANEKRKRQSDYLEAIKERGGVETFEGHYLAKPMRCLSCQNQWTRYEEKITDVQIATQLLMDVFADRLDVAIVVSADSDLVPPVRAVRQTFKGKRIIVFQPPGRRSYDLSRAAHHTFAITDAMRAASQLPNLVVKADGTKLRRPAKWT